MESSVYLITFACYGSHVPGDNGIVDRGHNTPGGLYTAMDEGRLTRAKRVMRFEPYLLDERRRGMVLAVIHEVCECRGWMLMAAHVRTNHVHVVVVAAAKPEQVMSDFKAYASRALNRIDDRKQRHWARHGSTRYLWNHADIGGDCVCDRRAGRTDGGVHRAVRSLTLAVRCRE